VANTSDRPDIPYRVAILDHESINAFAAPAGYIFVTRGLLRQIKNEAELAAVLGHEIAHVSEKHILDVIQRSKRLAGVTEAGLSYATSNPAAFKGVIDGAVKKLLDEGSGSGERNRRRYGGRRVCRASRIRCGGLCGPPDAVARSQGRRPCAV
jgi:hypothetical protein